MKLLTLAILLSIGIASKAYGKPQYNLELQPISGQPDNWQNGMQYIDDVKAGSIVRVVSSQDPLPDKQSTFRVIVLNTTDKPITFGPENITIQYGKDKAVQMVTHEELVAKLRRDIKRRQALATLGAAFSAQGADGRTTGNFDYSGITNGGGFVSGSGSYTAYDPALAQQQQVAAQEQSAAVARAINGRRLTGTQALENVFRKTTIQPGAMMGGVAAYNPPSSFKQLSKGEKVTIVVTVGTEQHRIAAKVSKVP